VRVPVLATLDRVQPGVEIDLVPLAFAAGDHVPVSIYRVDAVGAFSAVAVVEDYLVGRLGIGIGSRRDVVASPPP